MSRDQKVKLKSSDGQIFEVDVLVAYQSQLVKNIIESQTENNNIEDTGADTVIPLPNVLSNVLSKVIEYCTLHVEGQKNFDARHKEEQERLDEKIAQAQKTLDEKIGREQKKLDENIKEKHKRFDEYFKQEQKRLDENIKQGQKRFNEHTKQEQKMFDEKVKHRDAKFMKVNRATLNDLMMTAVYLDIAKLVDLTSKTYADIIKTKSAEEITMFLNNKNDATL